MVINRMNKTNTPPGTEVVGNVPKVTVRMVPEKKAAGCAAAADHHKTATCHLPSAE